MNFPGIQNMYYMIDFFFRRRVPPALESATIKPTLSAEGVGIGLSTSRRKDVQDVVILWHAPGISTGLRKHKEGRLLAQGE